MSDHEGMDGDHPMRPNDPMRRVGATWCDQHRRWECTKNAKGTATRCHGSAITGTDRCRMHAGEKSALTKAKGEAITAWTALAGQPTVSATEAVLGMLQMSWLRVHIYAGLLEEQLSAAQENRGGDGAGSVGPGAGLIGHTFGAVKDIGIYASGEAVRGMALLEAQERDRCVRYAKTAHDMGIAEHQIRVAEEQGRLLGDVIRRVLAALGLTAEQRALVPEVVPRELRAVRGA
jgi:hypothetical protein